MTGLQEKKLRLRLPATSANLGPGFDAAAVAFSRYLEIEAEPATEFSIAASGRDAERCSQLKDNLILEHYKRLLGESGGKVTPLAFRMDNGIPLGMGLGSSAAGRLAAVVLANHFGRLGWDSNRILEEACILEGHPDNAAACWLGGFVMAATSGRTVHAARATPPADWRPIIVLPEEPLATTKARNVLPPNYPRADVVANLQSAGLLGLAFAQGRGDLLRIAMRDRVHQPYRAAICPLLDPLLPLAGHHGILGVALSGAGPSVLVIAGGEGSLEPASAAIRAALQDQQPYELLVCRFERRAANRAS
jgi:homoserine kinase